MPRTRRGAQTLLGVDGTTLQVSGGTVSVKASGITATQLANDAVETAKIKDANVTLAKLIGTWIPASGARALADNTYYQPSATRPSLVVVSGGIDDLVLNDTAEFQIGVSADGVSQDFNIPVSTVVYTNVGAATIDQRGSTAFFLQAGHRYKVYKSGAGGTIIPGNAREFLL